LLRKQLDQTFESMPFLFIQKSRDATEMAEVVMLLLSDAESYMTGSLVDVSGWYYFIGIN